MASLVGLGLRVEIANEIIKFAKCWATYWDIVNCKNIIYEI
jgi:hypothetical protein